MKQNISLAPNNASAWNYLRGILTQTKTPLSVVATFVKPYAASKSSSIAKADGSRDIVDLENPPPGDGADLPCAEALEFLADMYEAQGSAEGVQAAVEVCPLPLCYILEA